jgi:branched-chain amino acid transport system substrate-binding protein
MKRFVTSLLFTCAAACTTLAYATDGVASKQIIIGQNITLQGGKNDYGMAVQAGVQTYLQAVNAKGGVHGRQIVLKTLDDNNKGSEAEANARKLVEQEKVFILFGSIEGGPSTSVMKAAVDLKVPFFGPMAGSPTLRRPYQPMVFPVRAEHREEFRALMDYTKKTGGTRVAFMRSDSDVGLQHLDNVKKLCAEMGMELVLDMPFKSDTTDAQITQYADAIIAKQPHVVFNHGGIGTYEKLIRTSRAKGMRNVFHAVNSGSAQLAKHLGELSHGMVFAQVVPSPWERKTAITREYQDEFSKQRPGQDFSYGSLEGYITAKALVSALLQAGANPTRESFVAGLTNSEAMDINGLRANFSKTADYAGLKLVDLAIVTRDGKFRH